MSGKDIDNLEVPTSDGKDHFNWIVSTVLSSIPYASPILGKIMPPPREKKMYEFWNSIVSSLRQLQEKNQSLENQFRNLGQNEKFHTALIQASEIVYKNHQREKLEYARNAVLNSALPTVPEDDLQMRYLQLLNDLTGWDVKILRLFDPENGFQIPELSLESNWKKSVNVVELAEIIETRYPEMAKHEGIYFDIVKKLFDSGLIDNYFPSKSMLTKTSHRPRITTTAQGFLKFITSPINEKTRAGEL